VMPEESATNITVIQCGLDGSVTVTSWCIGPTAAQEFIGSPGHAGGPGRSRADHDRRSRREYDHPRTAGPCAMILQRSGKSAKSHDPGT
jgi:hypothetical protein